MRLMFHSGPVQNNSVVTTEEIGESEKALICATNLRPCCNSLPNRQGEWYYPNGSLVPPKNAGHDFYRSRGDDGTVRLNRKNDILSPMAIFYCVIPDSQGISQYLYAGVYPDVFLLGMCMLYSVHAHCTNHQLAIKNTAVH